MLFIVTGANGHLGNNLVRKLKLLGHDVRALILPKDDKTLLEKLGAAVYFGDITKMDDLHPLFDLTNSAYTYDDLYVVHSAGIISISNKKNQLMEKVNVEGTKNILSLAKQYQVKQFIHISSVHAIKELPKDEIISETYHFDPDLVVGAYAKTKAEATKYVIDSFVEGFPITIVFPSGIIGPYDFGKGHLTKLIEKYLNKELSARVRGQYDFVDVRDVVDGIYDLAITHSLGPYILSGHQVELEEMFAILKEISETKKKTPVIAKWFVKIFTPLTELYYRIKKEPPLFTAYSLYTLKTNSQFNHKKATETIGYAPRPFKETIVDTALWLIEAKRLNKNKIIDFILNKFRKK